MGRDCESPGSDHDSTTAAASAGGGGGAYDDEETGGGRASQEPKWDPNLLLKLNIYHTEDPGAGAAAAGGAGGAGTAAGSGDKSKRLYVLDLQLSRGHVCEFMQLSLQVIALLKTKR